MADRISHGLIQALRSVPVFASLDDATLLEVVGGSANLFWPEAREVFSEGHPAEGLYLVLSGRVRILAGDDTIAEVGEGEYFGEDSLLAESGQAKKARTLQDTELMVIPKGSLAELMEANPTLRKHVQATLAARRGA